MKYEEIAALGQTLKNNMEKVMVGRGREIELLLTAMLCGGHVLLEDMPGTGKTTLAKSLARSMDCSFARVQATPDLLPADITGTRVWQQQTQEFVFLPGPVFTHVLLVDEINRATPRTQSALLECMEERQCTDGGVTRPLPSPFMVIATQNPVETQGTFPLPEAQLDRFLMRLGMGYPEPDEALVMLRRFMADSPLDTLPAVCSKEQLLEAQKLCAVCQVSDDVIRYMDALCRAAQDPQLVRLGPSPRALLMLMHACQALAALRGRDYVIPDDVKELAVPVLAHRVILRGMYTQTPEEFIASLLDKVPAPTEEAL